MNIYLASYRLYRKSPDSYSLLSTVDTLPEIMLFRSYSGNDFVSILTEELISEYPDFDVDFLDYFNQYAAALLLAGQISEYERTIKL